VHYVEDDAGLAAAVQALGQGEVYFIDTEFESTRRATTLSLLQVSVASRAQLAQGEHTFDSWLLDALKLKNLAELGPVMLRDGVEWVLHAGLQDVELLLECFRLPRPPRLFDTQVAWALLGPEANTSLAYLQFRLLGVRTMKSHQADNWMRRPLPLPQLEYAAKDIEHLPALYLSLVERLQQAGRGEAVSAACHEALWPKPELPAELTLASFRNAWQLEPQNQAALRYLIEWFNGLPAWERDRAPVPKTMLSIASRLPKTAKDLLRIKGLPAQFGTGYAEAMVRGMTRAVAMSSDAEFVRIDPEPYATFEDIQLDAWLSSLRANVSCSASVAPELAFPARLQRTIRQAAASGETQRIPDLLDGWRQQVLAAHTRAFIDAHPFAKAG
jgi:ribonuclease D